LCKNDSGRYLGDKSTVQIFQSKEIYTKRNSLTRAAKSFTFARFVVEVTKMLKTNQCLYCAYDRWRTRNHQQRAYCKTQNTNEETICFLMISNLFFIHFPWPSFFLNTGRSRERKIKEENVVNERQDIE
jgi:hypothetical protein